MTPDEKAAEAGGFTARQFSERGRVSVQKAVGEIRRLVNAGLVRVLTRHRGVNVYGYDIAPSPTIVGDQQRLFRLREWARARLLRILERAPGKFDVIRQPDNALLLQDVGLDDVEGLLRREAQTA